MRSRYIAVPAQKGEKIRCALLEEGLLRRDLAIARDSEFVYFPVTEGEDVLLGFTVFERDFIVLDERFKSYREIVEVPEDLKSLLPTSFDVIGKIAIIKLPEELMPYKEAVGKAILKANKSIETVANDEGVKGEERIRLLEIMAGKNQLATVHKEYGIELELDLSRVYFSPRLATEHWSVAQMVKEGEVVIDMFCGAGPFSILIAKNSRPKTVYAVDINEDAIHYLRRNIERNKVSNIKAMQGDSKEIVPELESAHRIIMNLPFSAYEFLWAALTNIKDKSIIHYYEVLGQEEKEKRIHDIMDIAGSQGIEIVILGERQVHTYSPDSSLYCLDLEIIRGKENVRSNQEDKGP